MVNLDTEKTCTKCGIPKPLRDFYPAVKETDGRRDACILCIKKQNSAWKARSKDKILTAAQRWNQRHPEQYRAIKSRSVERRRQLLRGENGNKIRQNNLKTAKKWRENNPDKHKRYGRNRILKLFGVTHSWYDETLALQNGGCAICGSIDPKGSGTHFSIDHNHKCCGRRRACEKCRRGLLCFLCNTQLALVENKGYKYAPFEAYLLKYEELKMVA